MAEGYAQERTESATPKRREQARESGRVVHSRDVVSACVFLAHLGFFAYLGLSLWQQMLRLWRDTLSRLAEDRVTVENVYGLFASYLGQLGWMLGPLFLTICLAGVAANLLQNGWVFAPKALAPDLTRLNPWQGLGRLFSVLSVYEAVKSLLKVGVVGYITYTSIAADFAAVFPLSQQTVAEMLAFLGRQCLQLGTHVSYALIAMAVLDYGFQRWQYEKSLRMSLQEVKEERKEAEGNPQIKARVRSVMREMARKRMMAEVPKADVVITNPTHLAVAVRYRRQEMRAPMVIAKGAGYMAERIKALAREHQIPLVENRPVAQSLYKTVEIGAVIPETLYKAVAEILAYVYRLRPWAVV